MSKITNDGLTRSGTGCLSTHMSTVDIKGLSRGTWHSVCSLGHEFNAIHRRPSVIRLQWAWIAAAVVLARSRDMCWAATEEELFIYSWLMVNFYVMYSLWWCLLCV